jgi:hypothetical protein
VLSWSQAETRFEAVVLGTGDRVIEAANRPGGRGGFLHSGLLERDLLEMTLPSLGVPSS